MTVTGQLSSTARFCTFSPQIFLKHIFLCYILIIYYNFRCGVSRNMGTTSKLGFCYKVNISAVFEFFVSKSFLKCLISCQILIIWWKNWVLLTIIFYLKIWLSPGSHRGRCYPYDSHSSTELNSSFSQFFTSNFFETYFFMLYFDNLMQF